MKKNNRVLLVPLTATFLLASCQQVFDAEPLDRVVESEVWRQESLVQAYVNALYAEFPFSPFPQRGNLIAQAGGELFGSTPTPTTMEDEGGYWDYGYIRDLNVFLEEIVDAEVPQETKDRLIGEVRTIRAVVYFEMQKRYGGVPLVDVVLDPFDLESIDQKYLTRATEEEVADFIDSELAAAIQLLPANPDLSRTGRINRNVAQAYKARANLWSASIANFPAPLAGQSELIGIPAGRAPEFYQKASAAADAVINSGDYSLYTAGLPDHAANYQQLFLDNGNSEVIFERHFDGLNIISNFTYLNVSQHWSAGQGGSHVSLDLLLDYENLDGSLTPPAMGPENRYEDGRELWMNKDPRVRAIVFHQGDVYGGRPFEVWESTDPSPAGTANLDALLTDNLETYNGVRQVGREGGRLAQGTWLSDSGLHIKKYLLPGPVGGQHTGDGELTTLKEIRLAEMYLIKAEAEFELGNTGVAAQALNMTRERAGLPPVQDVGGITRERVRTERLSELALEARRYWDLRRWRTAEAELQGRQFRGLRTIYHAADDNFYFLPSDDQATGSDPEGERQFLPYYYYNPITEVRIADNPLLQENPGY